MDSVFVPLGTLDAATVVPAVGLGAPGEHWLERDILDPSLERDTSNQPGPWHEHYVVTASSWGRLRETLSQFSAEGRARQVLVVVEDSDPAQPVAPGLTEQPGETFIERTVDGIPGARVWGMRSTAWLDVHGVLCALAAQGRRSLPLAGMRLGLVAQAAPWGAGDPQARWVPEDLAVADSEPVDSVDAALHAPAGTYTEPGTLLLQTATSQTELGELLPPVDPYTCSPTGFKVFPGFARASMVPLDNGRRWRLDLDEPGDSASTVWDTRAGGFTEPLMARLRDFGTVHLQCLNRLDPWITARFLSQLAMAGVPVTFDQLDPRSAALLGEPVMAGLKGFAGTEPSALARESASITSRRAALRTFLPRRRGGELRRRAGLPITGEPTITVLLATKRSGMVSHALGQIRAQTLGAVETVLILHGLEAADADIAAAIAAYPRELQVVEAPQSLTLGGALNLGLARASGHYVAKMDDDDWYGPHHLEDLLLAREYSDAVLVGAPVEFTYLAGPDITTRRNHAGEQFTRHVAGGTMFLSRHDLMSVGGWRNTPSAVDRGLIDAILASGGRVYRTHGQNYMMHRRASADSRLAHTWQADDSVFLQDVREQWNGFHPAPQLNLPPRQPSQELRSAHYRSWFSGRHNAP